MESKTIYKVPDALGGLRAIGKVCAAGRDVEEGEKSCKGLPESEELSKISLEYRKVHEEVSVCGSYEEVRKRGLQRVRSYF